MDLDVDKDNDLLEQEQKQDGGYWLDEERNVKEFLVLILLFSFLFKLCSSFLGLFCK